MKKEKRPSQGYKIALRTKKQAVILKREDWCDVLLELGPRDGTDRLYDLIESQVRIFDGDEEDLPH